MLDGGQVTRLRSMDQHECHTAISSRSIRPAVIGRALDQNVALAHQRLVLVQHRMDLTFEHDRVVERRRDVEPQETRRVT